MRFSVLNIFGRDFGGNLLRPKKREHNVLFLYVSKAPLSMPSTFSIIDSIKHHHMVLTRGRGRAESGGPSAPPPSQEICACKSQHNTLLVSPDGIKLFLSECGKFPAFKMVQREENKGVFLRESNRVLAPAN